MNIFKPVLGNICHSALATLVAVSLVATSANAQAEFDPGECARIQDVDVPFEVTADDGSLSFAGDVVIEISNTSLSVDGAQFARASMVADLHRDLRGFLNRAAQTASASAEFGSDWEAITEKLEAGGETDEATDEFLEALTNMCEAILDLDATQSGVASAFPAFVSPVKISLGE